MYRPQQMRSAIVTARVALQPIASSSRIVIPAKSSPPRALHTSPKLRARYERFDPQPQWRVGSSGGNPGGGGGPKFTEYLKRRLGGDRAVWLYGIGLGGGGLYYVTQYVCIFGDVMVISDISLERTPETGRLRFMDVNEAQEREVRPSRSTLADPNTDGF